MLFHALACFSPSVPPVIRKLWVRNGGTLTHTAADFRNAQFFFCVGMEDPWLNELLSRALIVRHAAWVTLCVFEQFRMPIAAYTLDESFTLEMITILDPLTVSHRIGPKETKDPPGTCRTPKPVAAPKQNILVTRKRPIDTGDGSEPQTNSRPKKKARIDAHVLVFPELYDKLPGSARETSKENPRGQKAPERLFSVFPDPLRRPKSSNATENFEKHIYVNPRPIALDLTPHNLCWNDLLATRILTDDNTTLTLSLDELLQTPGTKATIFNINKTYLGRTFSNRGYKT